jgi:hypothetical protein
MSYFFNAPIQIPESSNLALIGSGSNKFYFNANSSMSSSYSLTLPSADGTANQVLSTDGSGNLAFVDQTGSSEIASNAVINSTSGDIVFTTDSGNVNVGTTSGNLTINAAGASDIMHIVGNNQIFISTNGNVAQSDTDTSNLTAIFRNDAVGFTKYLNIADTTQASGVGFTGTGSIVTFGGASIAKDAVVGGNVEIISNASNAVVLKVNDSMTSSLELTLPSTDGTSGQVLQTNGSGILSFTDVSSTTSLDAANITIATAGEDIVFATTQGSANIGTYSGSTSVYALGGSNVVILSASANEPTSTSDTGNISLTISNTAVTSHRATTLQSTLDVTGQTNLNATTTSTSTTTGALVVDGGVGIAENLFVGGTGNVTGATDLMSTLDVHGAATMQSTLDVTGQTNLNATTTSTSTTTGALVVDGGVGIAENLFIGGTANVTGATDLMSTLDVHGAATMQSTLDVTGQTNLNDTTQSTSTTTGALIVDGGVGIAKNAYVGGALVVTGDLTVNGTTTTVNSNVTTVDDPVIQIGTDSNDDLDRGIKALYNDGSSKSAFFGWQRNGANDEFTFIPDATFSSANVATGTIGDAKFYNMDLSGNVTVSGTSTLTGVVSTSANVDVGGNVNVTKSVDVTQNLVVDGTSTLTGATTLSSTLGVTGAITLSGQTNINNKLVVSVDEFASSVGSTTDVWNGSNASANKHLMTNATGLSNYSSSGSYTTGQMMNIFYTNTSGGTASANLDFGASSLYTGSGTAQYLVFNTTGQSASLIYIDASGANDGWRIINTGAEVY